MNKDFRKMKFPMKTLRKKNSFMNKDRNRNRKNNSHKKIASLIYKNRKNKRIKKVQNLMKKKKNKWRKKRKYQKLMRKINMKILKEMKNSQ